MLKRLFDIVASVAAISLLAPLIGLLCLAIWLQDRHSPIYRAWRVGQRGEAFLMLKLRSMVIDAHDSGVDSTRATDSRITPVGHIIRRFKLDELPQFWNVLKGEMSLVGPRPNVAREVSLYTNEERRLLTMRPGITDLASIVFSDEGEILEAFEDPDIAYNQLIRPWKSQLGLFYLTSRTFRMDLRVLTLTPIAIFSRKAALRGAQKILAEAGASDELIGLAARETDLTPVPPPGMTRMVTSRDDRPEAVPDSLFDLSSVTEDWETLASVFQRRAAALRYGLCRDLAAERRFLEVGCGTGFGLEFVAKQALVALGIDAMATNVNRCIERCKLASARIGLATHLPVENNSFDVVACLETIYYIDDQERAMEEMARAVSPGGRVILTVPNPQRPGFHPSPGSTHYPTLSELHVLLRTVVDEVTCYGAFPFTDSEGPMRFVAEIGRRALSKFHLMPRTIEGRGRLKALVQSDVKPMSTFDQVDVDLSEELHQVQPGDEWIEYTVLFAVGVRR